MSKIFKTTIRYKLGEVLQWQIPSTDCLTWVITDTAEETAIAHAPKSTEGKICTDAGVRFEHLGSYLAVDLVFEQDNA